MHELERCYHLTLDAIGCKNTDALRDLSFLYDLLDELPGRIGMLLIMPPILRKWLKPPDLENGVSGFVLIAESHISIHTFPEKQRFYFDCFSCKEFDAPEVLRILYEFFLFDREGSRVNLPERG